MMTHLPSVMRLVLALLLLAAPAAWACTEQSCSNDPVPAGVAGVLGDETLAWDAAVDPNGDVVTYELWSTTRTDGPCLITAQTSLLLAGTSCLSGTDTARVRVRGCDPGGLCGGYSGEVEFLPHACIEGNHEVPCYPGAPLRLPVML